MTEVLLQKDKKSQISGFMLERTAKRLKQYFQQQLASADAGITIDQWVVLQVLDKDDGLSQLEIGRATAKDAPTITRIIDLLCKKQLTSRIADLSDRRRFKIELTDKGRKKIEKVLPIIKDSRRETWKGLADEDMDHLVRTLKAIIDNLK